MFQYFTVGINFKLLIFIFFSTLLITSLAYLNLSHVKYRVDSFLSSNTTHFQVEKSLEAFQAPSLLRWLSFGHQLRCPLLGSANSATIGFYPVWLHRVHQLHRLLRSYFGIGLSSLILKAYTTDRNVIKFNGLHNCSFLANPLNT